MSAASKESLGLLHEAFARACKDILQNGVTTQDDEGKPVVLTAPAAYLNVVRQFLKDNGIESPLVPAKGSAMAALAGLPFAGADHPANRDVH